MSPVKRLGKKGQAPSTVGDDPTVTASGGGGPADDRDLEERTSGDTSIEAYRAKRDFGQTPEPTPGTFERLAKEPVFVVQRHDARRLHYDLRLEMEGVLRSFAVPKGFSWNPTDKHLAVRTEDHPLEYYDFEGVIPKGAYGAGTMAIWDRGTYTLRKGGDGPRAVAAGKLEVAFDGGRLRGEWHMVRTARDPRDWLLFKYKDRYARGPDDPLFPIDLSRTDRSPYPDAPCAMEPGEQVQAFYDSAWLFELRFAGRRLLFGQDNGFRAFSADGSPLSLKLPELETELDRLRASRVLLDGVLVAVDEGGRPNRELLEARLAAGATADLVYYAFDILHYDDWDLRPFPLAQRKRALESLLPRGLPRILYVDHVVGRGDELLAVVAASGLPGILAKDGGSRYRAGPDPSWRIIEAGSEGAATGGHVFDRLSAPGAPREIRTRVKLSNPDKVYWPKEGFTKGQLLDYYDRIAETLLPYLRDRPVHLLRYPEGIEGHAFYQKDLVEQLPDWVHTAVVAEKEGAPVRYVVCNDRDTLLYLVNLGSIDLHPWMSRVDSMESPDYLVIDLDPSTDDFAPVVKIARELGKILHGAGMRPLLKTSGASGLHVFIPLKEGYTYEQARMFAELVARLVTKDNDDIATVERVVAKRGRKVYVDYLQNAREQTVVPAYVARPKPGATVSTPLDWDELDTDLRREDFNILTVPARVDVVGDLFRGLLDDPHDLVAAVEKLQSYQG